MSLCFVVASRPLDYSMGSGYTDIPAEVYSFSEISLYLSLVSLYYFLNQSWSAEKVANT